MTLLKRIHENAPKIEAKTVTQIAEVLLPHGKAYEWNQALMDYSSTVLKREKIHVPKQSKFIGSNRFYRGQLVKVLLDKKAVRKATLGPLIKDHFSDADHEWFETLLRELTNEGFITVENDLVRLSS